MSRIQQLSPHVVNKIAAGEVIERPASVVKELLENSVDALATRIEIDIEQGGTELIRIVDDGEGIHPEDLLLAVASHATSKLREADDLFRVQTLGFRGEALASIAEVSHFRVRSRTADLLQGTELVVRCGDLSEPQLCGCPLGTQIEVEQLFVNTPVRRRFLKTTSTEFGHISEQFTKIALANPRLHMVLRHNGKTIYELPATESVLDRITLFHGGELAKQLIWVESEMDGIRLWGYVGHPSVSKSTRKSEWLFLNGRWIQDRALQHALTEAYRGLLMVGRNPICFLFLEVPADQVDVNVHPTKAEVRFRDGQRLYRQTLSTLRSKFLGMNLDSILRVGPLANTGASGPPVDPQKQREAQLDLVSWASQQAERWAQPAAASGPPAATVSSPAFTPPDRHAALAATAPFTLVTPSFSQPTAPEGAPAWEQSDSAVAVMEAPEPRQLEAAVPLAVEDRPKAETVENATAFEAVEAAPAVSPVTPPLQPTVIERKPLAIEQRAMQIHDSYLVVETVEGLQVVDQHALHERILYEQLRNRILAGSVESQRMLIPETVEVTAADAALLKEHETLLRQFGLHVEAFGGQTVLVTAYPVLLSRLDPAEIIREVSEQLAASSRGPSRRDLLDTMLHMMSCKAAIKAGQRLTPEEIDSLLTLRHLVDDAHHCPHGRPTALMLSRTELDRQFGRLG